MLVGRKTECECRGRNRGGVEVGSMRESSLNGEGEMERVGVSLGRVSGEGEIGGM